MNDRQTYLHSIDLRQIEAMSRLVAQLTSELEKIKDYDNAVALGLQGREQYKIKVPGYQKVTEEAIEKNIKAMQLGWERHVQAAKACIFRASNTITQLHETRTRAMNRNPLEEHEKQPPLKPKPKAGKPAAPNNGKPQVKSIPRGPSSIPVESVSDDPDELTSLGVMPDPDPFAGDEDPFEGQEVFEDDEE